MFDDSLSGKLENAGVSALLSHPPMGDRRASIAAHAIIRSLALGGRLRVFPSPNDYWHFDDKVAQKYAFDAVGIPTPDAHVFLRKEEALAWAADANFPWVFKLSAGAGSTNVSLMRDQKEAVALINKMFARGCPPHNSAFKDVSNKLRRHRAAGDWLATLRRAPATLRQRRIQRRELDWERGYFYCQEFIAENRFDTRVTVIGTRAFAFRRMVRPGDFRASGSGAIDHDPGQIDMQCVERAFDAARRLGTTCMAFDFVNSNDGRGPLIVEMSYAFNAQAVFDCPGHWQPDMTWQAGQVWPQDAILDDVLHQA
jgi:glutathione synthase/RimK-type ligase-like ATP-grasp enzyme